MNLSAIPSLSPEQIAAEIAEMRKAARAIAASPRKSLAFLRQVGVLNSTPKQRRSKRKTTAAIRNH
ncbi:MAG: hypothetical protein HYY24_25735 [Verrucomicrobia bacterium]|nr:hypothetical protein [Verrucomicrobiota bacterium]